MSIRAALIVAAQDDYRLILWCEHPGYEHPWTEASYDLRSTGWLQRLAPYAVLVSKALRVLVPMASANRLDVVPQELESVERELALMTSLVEKLPPLDQSNVGAIQNDQGLTRAEGASLRELRSFLFEVDESRYFGGLRRVLASSGDFLWVCPNHYVQYDPGLPSLPA
jgi:internalin A